MKLLRQLCDTKVTANKLNIIAEHLDNQAQIIPYIAQSQSRHAGKTFYNLYSHISAGEAKTIAITCHHDIVNHQSDNCLDNNASIYNLISLHNKLIHSKDQLKYDLVFAFVDAEELVDPYASGIYHLLHHYDIQQLVDLELTAGGKHIIINKYNDFDLLSYPEQLMPANNAAIASYLNKCRGSACLTLVDNKDLHQLNKYGTCDRWRQCHNISDTMDRWSNEQDMGDLIEQLAKVFV